MMQERWKELQELLEEMTTMKKREYFLIMAVCIIRPGSRDVPFA